MVTAGAHDIQSWHHLGSGIPSGYPALSWTVLFRHAHKRACERAGPEATVGTVRAVPARELADRLGCSFDNKSVAEIGKKCPLLGGRRRDGTLGFQSKVGGKEE